jgi:hypothetical protein
LLFLSGEISMGVAGCPAGALALIVGWVATVAAGRSLLAVEKSAEAVVPTGIGLVVGKGRTRSRA